MPALFEEFSKRTIEAHVVKVHGFSKNLVRGRRVHRDAMASQNQHFANCSRFQLAWERVHVSTQAPPNLAADGPAPPLPALGANVPPPGDGEDRGAAASDAARFYSTPVQEEMEAEPAPPPAAGPSTDGVSQRRHWKQDTLASEDRLKARLGQTQTNTHQAVESSDAALREGLGEVQAKYRVALADFVETYDARRHGGAFPANLLKTKLQLGRVQTYHLRVSGPSLMQLPTTFSVTIVVSSGVSNMVTSLVMIFLTLWYQLTELD